MKKSIYIFGIFCLSIVLIGTLFKTMHLPGSSILLTLGLLCTSLLFLPIALFHCTKATTDPLLKFVYYMAYISFTVDFVGMLFKIMHWPGASWFMIVGVPLPFVLFLPAYLVYHTKRKLKTDLNFLGVILVMIYLGVFSSMLAINVGYNVYKGYAQAAQELSQTNKLIAAVSCLTFRPGFVLS